MKLFWGLLEFTPKHQHTFDPAQWKQISRTDLLEYEELIGERICYVNTCVTCGDLIQRIFYQTSI